MQNRDESWGSGMVILHYKLRGVEGFGKVETLKSGLSCGVGSVLQGGVLVFDHHA